MVSSINSLIKRSWELQNCDQVCPWLAEHIRLKQYQTLLLQMEGRLISFLVLLSIWSISCQETSEVRMFFHKILTFRLCKNLELSCFSYILVSKTERFKDLPQFSLLLSGNIRVNLRIFLFFVGLVLFVYSLSCQALHSVVC